jgi:2-dehydro-3-deoxygluconokinase
LLEGMGFTQAVDRGVWIGARAVQVLGDNEGLPTRAELDQSFRPIPQCASVKPLSFMSK